jgi:hypothetical protein
MPTLAEDRQYINYDSSWQLCQWDDCDEFTNGLREALHGTSSDGVKGADFVGIRKSRPQVVLVGEFKDFANPRIPSDQRSQAAKKAESSQLVGDLVRKVIDTLAGATFSHDNSGNRRPELGRWRPALPLSTTRLLVVVCIEVPKPAIVNMIAAALTKRLRWLGPNATVLVTTAATPFTGLGLTYELK